MICGSRLDCRGFVALVLGLLGVLMIVGFVVLLVKLGALADELREARASDAHQLATQLDAIADKQQGTRLDLDRMTKVIATQGESLAALALEFRGPPSLRRPTLPGGEAHGAG